MAKPTLTVNVTNLQSADAPVEMSIYGPDNNFPDPKGQLAKYRFTPVNGVLAAKITDVPFGQYAIALYQDINNNGKLDTNFLGIPNEPIGFSNITENISSKPKFADCAFTFDADNNAITIRLIKVQVL
jgi:uncharacterized protein (DUF2141 family)